MNKTNKNPVVAPFESAAELAVDTLKKAPGELIKTFVPFSDMFETAGKSGEKNAESTSHTPLDFDKLHARYAENETADIQRVRQELGLPSEVDGNQLATDNLRQHRKFQRETIEFQQQLAQEEQQQKEQAARAQAQQDAQPVLPKGEAVGKTRVNILGGGHKKASTALPPQMNVESRPGSSKH